MIFQRNDQVIWVREGKEITATVRGYAANDTGDGADFYEIYADGKVQHMKASDVLAPKKPGFEIRDLAFVLDESRDAVQGEVVATGIGPKNRTFYQMRFEPAMSRAQSWYSEDEVFTISSSRDDSRAE